MLFALAGLAPLLSARGRWYAGLALGFGACLLQLADYESLRLTGADEERQLLACRIASLPARSGAEAAFDATCRPLRGGVRTRRLRLRWPDAPRVGVGERWQLLVQLRAPRARANPGSDDGLRTLRQLRIHGLGRVLGSPLDARLAPAGPGIDPMREHVAADIATAVPERDAAALIAALAVGDTRRVTAQQWRLFSVTGISHLVAISGLHVTLFGLMAAAVARRLWNWCAPLRGRVAREGFALLAGLVAATGYALLAGFSVPAQRTLIMLAAWCLTRLAVRAPAVAPPLAVALIGVLLLDPCAPLGAGFWLSFVAVAALMLAARDGPAAGPLATVGALARAQGVVAVALLPVGVIAFGTVSWAGLAVNFVAIPLFSFVLVPLVLGGMAAGAVAPWLGRLLYGLAARVIDALLPPLQALADLDGALWHLAPPPWWYLLAAAAALLVLLPWRLPLRLSAALALLPALFPPSTAPRPGELRLVMLDTGRALAVIVQTAQHSLLYDLGESYGSGGATTARIVLPALRALGIGRLDELVLPHVSRERGAGVTALLAELPVTRLRTGAAGSAPLPPEYSGCTPGTAWDWDGVRFEILAAPECVLRIATPGATALLLGDLDPAAQRRLVAAGLGPTDVVQVPRHGAATGFEPALLAATRPRLALVANGAAAVGTGRVAATLGQWRDAGTEVRVTGEAGAIVLRMRAPVGIMPRPVAWESSGRCGKSCARAGR